MPRDVVVLGSTGSVGTQTLEVVAAAGDAYRVRALSAAGTRLDRLADQAARFAVPVVAVADPAAADALRVRLAHHRAAPEVVAGPAAAAEVAGSLGSDGVVVNGITGSVGLGPTLAALSSGARLALANKESLVVGGPLVRRAQVRPGQVVPVDSEHSAIAQALAGGRHERGMTAPVRTGRTEVRRLVLTASGGPFRGRSRAELTAVTPAQALAHPTWDMGPVVTVNSATLVNKGLELIEAHLLFDVPPEDIVVVVHPQSVVHSMVEFVDGSTLAQASPPDMRLPIALGLTWPERPRPVVPPCRWDRPAAWTFEPVDEDVFPAVRLAREAVAASATHPAVLNAANEQSVAAFLAGRLPYLRIAGVLEEVLAEHDGAADVSLEGLADVERWARARADALIGS